MKTETDAQHCMDCGRDDPSVALYPGTVSAPSDEGHVRHTHVALCATCAARRLAVQEPNFG